MISSAWSGIRPVERDSGGDGKTVRSPVTPGRANPRDLRSGPAHDRFS